MAKGKAMGKGLAALIRTNKKEPKNITEAEKETEEEAPEQQVDEELLQKWAKKKADAKNSEDSPKKKTPKIDHSNSDKQKAYQERLDKFRSRSEERFKAKSKEIDPETDVWAEEEFISPIGFDYFERNKGQKPRERYEQLLKGIKAKAQR